MGIVNKYAKLVCVSGIICIKIDEIYVVLTRKKQNARASCFMGMLFVFSCESVCGRIAFGIAARRRSDGQFRAAPVKGVLCDQSYARRELDAVHVGAAGKGALADHRRNRSGDPR